MEERRRCPDDPPDLGDITLAHERIEPHVHRTPVLTCATIDRMTGGSIYFKCENLQKVGAFKIRGACNAVLSMSDEQASRGVATHSSGNHAQALALAAKIRGIDAHIVMPRNTAKAKMDAVADYGGKVTLCEPTLFSRETTVKKVIQETGAAMVHPYNDARIIAGQGTATVEMLDVVPDPDVIIVPVGGGGLISGTSIVAAALAPNTRVIGAEPAGADDAYRSFRDGRLHPMKDPQTMADGLRTSLGTLTFGAIVRHVHKIVTVTEEQIADAMRLVWERMKLVIEPSAAVAVAVALDPESDLDRKRVGIILSGGNADLDNLPW
jgi:threonine dehydratase